MIPPQQQSRIAGLTQAERRYLMGPESFGRRVDADRVSRSLQAHEAERFEHYRAAGYFGKSEVLRFVNGHLNDARQVIRQPHILSSFLGQEFWMVRPTEGERFCRFQSVDLLLDGYPGGFWTRKELFPEGEIQALMLGAIIKGFWNNFQIISEFTTPAGYSPNLYEGEVSGQLGPQLGAKPAHFQTPGDLNLKGAYFGGGNQLYFDRFAQRRMPIGPSTYRQFLWDRSEHRTGKSSGTPIELPYTVNQGRIITDFDFIRRHHRSLYNEIMAAKSVKEKS